MAFTREMGSALYAAAHEHDQFVSFALGLEPAQRLCCDWHQGACRRDGRRLRPLARGGVRARPTECLYAGREGGTRGALRELSNSDARPGKRSEGAGGCQGGEDGPFYFWRGVRTEQ